MSQLVAVDLFAGAGGLSLGLEAAGFRVLSAVERDPQAALTYAANHPGTRLSVADVREVSAADLLGRLRRPPDLVAGGPPCQGFSMKGPRTTGHPGNSMLREFVRLVGELRPRAVLLENVTGLLSMSGGFFFDRLITGLERVFEGDPAYTVEWSVLNASDFGVPQDRKRLFVVGSVEPGRKWRWPEPAEEAPYTIADAIADLPKEPAEGSIPMPYPSGHPPSSFAASARSSSPAVTNHQTKRLQDKRRRRVAFLLEGQDARHLPPDLRAGGHETKYRRLRRDAPAPTLTAHMGKDLSDFIHPWLHRTLTVREAARLQGFPDIYEFFGSQASQFRQVGNSVPPPLARVLGEQLRRSVLRRRARS